MGLIIKVNCIRDAKNVLRKHNWEKYANKYGFEIIITALTIEPDTLLAGIYPAFF